MESDPSTASLDERQRALVNYALKLTTRPAAITESETEALRKVGLSDAGIHDAAAIVAYFNFVNRMALGLGVELEDEYVR
ncbi:MAG: peroxidase [Blastocatellia bacterium]|nr:peroxidase [Blastocatellia bacterium]